MSSVAWSVIHVYAVAGLRCEIGVYIVLTERYIAENTLRVRYAETDAMGIVHHRNYLVYFEEARSHYARERNQPYSEFEKQGFYLMVTEANLRFLRAAHYDQEITVRAWIAEMRSRSVRFEYEVVDAQSDETLVTGYTKHICVTKSGKVARIPDTWKNWK